MIYLSLVPQAIGDLSSLVNCSDAVYTWFLQNALLLNPDKTEAVIFGTRQRLCSMVCMLIIARPSLRTTNCP